MTLTDTHCHIHEAAYSDKTGALERALEAGVGRLVLVGTDEITSREAAEFAAQHDGCWYSIGLHPHDATSGVKAIDDLRAIAQKFPTKLVAVGECGLDYFYNNSPREQQIDMLHAQFQLAQELDRPLIFHVREAFDDFWPIYEQYRVRGVLHSFTDSMQNLQRALSHNLFIGVNGISTFTKNPDQQAMFAAIPLQNLLLETDAPFLTPVPHRGTMNEPAFLRHVAAHLAQIRADSLTAITAATTLNATSLFTI